MSFQGGRRPRLRGRLVTSTPFTSGDVAPDTERSEVISGLSAEGEGFLNLCFILFCAETPANRTF